jgi:hypothetical protein
MSGDEGAGHIAAVLARAPAIADFKMASSRVGPAGGISLAKALSAGGGGGLQRWDGRPLEGCSIVRHPCVAAPVISWA